MFTKVAFARFLLSCCVEKFFVFYGCCSVCVLGVVFVCGCVLGFVWRGFGALSMLFSVKLQHGWCEDRMLPKVTFRMAGCMVCL